VCPSGSPRAGRALLPGTGDAISTVVLAALAAIALLSPAAMPGQTAKLQVSATVVRSMAVSVDGDASGGTLRVRTPRGAVVSAPLAAAARGGVSFAPHAEDPRFVVMTVHLDAPVTAATDR
jgi:hypothetical protein